MNEGGDERLQEGGWIHGCLLQHAWPKGREAAHLPGLASDDDRPQGLQEAGLSMLQPDSTARKPRELSVR